MMEIDAEKLREWIGREEIATDRITPALVDRFVATIGLLGDGIADGATAPRLIHFCLCQPVAAMAALGEDGHPARGGFLPPVPLPRRMWAGSSIAFSGDLKIGETVERRSRVADVQVKHGKTGALCFVTVDHVMTGESGGAVRDTQTIVYRGAGGPPPPAGDPAPQGEAVAAVAATPPLLFRYSALTFNGHRIHYDRDYATGAEGYPGLVVHGPLQATLLLHFAARQREGIAPDRFSFRSVASLYEGADIELHAATGADGAMSLWTCHPAGSAAMQAEAGWA